MRRITISPPATRSPGPGIRALRGDSGARAAIKVYVLPGNHESAGQMSPACARASACTIFTSATSRSAAGTWPAWATPAPRPSTRPANTASRKWRQRLASVRRARPAGAGLPRAALRHRARPDPPRPACGLHARCASSSRTYAAGLLLLRPHPRGRGRGDPHGPHARAQRGQSRVFVRIGLNPHDTRRVGTRIPAPPRPGPGRAEVSLTPPRRSTKLSQHRRADLRAGFLDAARKKPESDAGPQAPGRGHRQRRAHSRLTDDLDTLFELAREGEDVAGDIERDIKTYAELLERLETAMLLSGENDARSAIVTIHPGAGGTESQDWAEMLLRMYLRWAERARLPNRDHRPAGGRRRGHQIGHLRSQRRERLRAAAIGNRRAPPGAHLAVRRQRAPPYFVRLRVRLPAGGRRDQDRHQAGRSAHRYVPLLRRRRPARQHDRFGRAHHALPHQASWCSARTSARSTRTATPP